MNIRLIKLIALLVITTLAACQQGVMNTQQEEAMITENTTYVMPPEHAPHEGTWLQWPHHHQYGKDYRRALDPTWVAMTRALVGSEKVHIIAYDEEEKRRIINLLESEGVALSNVDFKIYQTDDVWIRDNGPIYVRDNNGACVIQDWGFNGWGQKTDDYTGAPIQYAHCNTIPVQIAADQGKPYVDLNTVMINEGGSVELDGHGTMMACKSSILNDNRNPGMTQEQAEAIFSRYLGVNHFIWLEGQAGLELTDQHIDGFARFLDTQSIVTMPREDLQAFDVKPSDIEILYQAKDKYGKPYTIHTIPLTQNNVVTTRGIHLGYKGSYINYYVANTVVLVPHYNDPNDLRANEILGRLYPNRTIIGIDVRNLYQNGGMVHCVTQQQPAE